MLFLAQHIRLLLIIFVSLDLVCCTTGRPSPPPSPVKRKTAPNRTHAGDSNTSKRAKCKYEHSPGSSPAHDETPATNYSYYTPNNYSSQAYGFWEAKSAGHSPSEDKNLEQPYTEPYYPRPLPFEDYFQRNEAEPEDSLMNGDNGATQGATGSSWLNMYNDPNVQADSFNYRTTWMGGADLGFSYDVNLDREAEVTLREFDLLTGFVNFSD